MGNFCRRHIDYDKCDGDRTNKRYGLYVPSERNQCCWYRCDCYIICGDSRDTSDDNDNDLDDNNDLDNNNDDNNYGSDDDNNHGSDGDHYDDCFDYYD